MDDKKAWWWRAAEKILAALADRQGVGDELGMMDDGIHAELMEEIADIIMLTYDAGDGHD